MTGAETDEPSKLRAYIQRAQLSCVMSDSKWKRLHHALEPLDPILDFRRKDVREESSADSSWNSELAYMLGRWDYIEWLEIRAKVMISRGALLDSTIEDHTPELIAAVGSSGVPFELTVT